MKIAKVKINLSLKILQFSISTLHFALLKIIVPGTGFGPVTSAL